MNGKPAGPGNRITAGQKRPQWRQPWRDPVTGRWFRWERGRIVVTKP